MKLAFWHSLVAFSLILSSLAFADAQNEKLDIYFIDVEGGAATLFVTSTGDSILIDSGYPDNNGRDLNRILDVARNVAKLDHIDHAVVTHWHIDHFGNHAALAAQIPIKNFWDRGIPDTLRDDKKFPERIGPYRAASQNMSKTLHAGDVFPDEKSKLPFKITVLTASREVVANTGEPNPFAKDNQPEPVDNSDNAASVSLLVEFGKFRFLCCGDLTWNVEAELVTPNNPIGKIDLFQVTHHGIGVSNNPVLVKAIDPVTAVMCNGPQKGGDAKTIATLRSCPSLRALFQLHRNVALSDAEQTPAELIANNEPTETCKGTWIKGSVAADGNSYTLQIGPDGQQRTYVCRGTEN